MHASWCIGESLGIDIVGFYEVVKEVMLWQSEVMNWDADADAAYLDIPLLINYSE